MIVNGRFVLYDLDDEFGSGSSTQAFVSTIFGSALIFSLSIPSSKRYFVFPRRSSSQNAGNDFA